MLNNKIKPEGRSERARVTDVSRFGFDEPMDRSQLSSMKWEAEIARKNDPDLLCLGTAEMDFRSAPAILHALQSVVDAGHFGYPMKRASYYDAIIGYFQRRFGWQVQKPWIASNVGIYPSMQPIIEELTEAGDEIVYQPPVHHIFPEIIVAAGRAAVANPLRLNAGRYEMDFDDLAGKITARTRMLLLCSPHNPVGRVWSRDELSRLSEICVANGIIVVTDEVYCGLIYPNVTFTPFAAVSPVASMTSITLVSASKSFNLTGLKHSLVITENPKFRDAYLRGLKRNNLYFGGCIFGQAATEAAFRDCDEWSDAAVAYIRDNYEHLKAFLKNHLPEVSLTEPEATYFAWLDFTRLGMADEELKSLLEDGAHVNATMGAPLGPGGEGHIRVNLATQRNILDQALWRLSDAFRQARAEEARNPHQLKG